MACCRTTFFWRGLYFNEYFLHDCVFFNLVNNRVSWFYWFALPFFFYETRNVRSDCLRFCLFEMQNASLFCWETDKRLSIIFCKLFNTSNRWLDTTLLTSSKIELCIYLSSTTITTTCSGSSLESESLLTAHKSNQIIIHNTKFALAKFYIRTENWFFFLNFSMRKIFNVI